MRTRHIVGLLFVLVGAALAWVWWFDGYWHNNKVSTKSGTAVLECPLQLDLGEQEHGQVVAWRLPLVNNGTADLDITDIRTSCACTGPEIEEKGQYRRITNLRIHPW